MTELAAQSGQDDEKYMRLAIEAARRGLLAGEPPIGACLVRGDDVIVTLNNAIIGELDVTAHAEMRVIREACRKLRTLALPGCRLYVTVEPCPMCMSACFYAEISEIVYGARLADINALTRSEMMAADSGSLVRLFADYPNQIELTGDCLRNECRSLLEEWAGGFSNAG